jgi:hypothetical protein
LGICLPPLLLILPSTIPISFQNGTKALHRTIWVIS